MKFSEKLTKLRKENKMSQQELAEYLDVSRQAVSKWESGISYPEMDKLLVLCKLFKCSLDDLTNDEKSEITVEETSKNNNIFISFLDLIVKTLDMFRSMRFKQLIECIFSMGLVVICLLLLLIPGSILYLGGLNIINSTFPFSLVRNIWYFITSFLYFFFFIITFFYVFKRRYLDNFIPKEKVLKKSTDNTLVKDSKKMEYKEKELVIVQKETDSTILKLLVKIFIICFKCFFFLFVIPFIISFVVLFAVLIIDIVLLFKGVLYIGVTLGIIFAIVLNYVLLELAYDFLFNKKIMLKRIFIMIITSLAGLGISAGVFAYEITNTDYIDGSLLKAEPEVIKSIKFDKNIIISDLVYGYDREYSFVVDDNLTDKIEIEAIYDKNYRNVVADYDEMNKQIFIYPYENDNLKSNKLIIDMIIEDLSIKEVHNYSSLYDYKIVIKSSSKNIDILKKNIEIEKEKEEVRREEERKNSEKLNYQSQIDDYEIQIQNYETEIEELNNKIERLNEKNEDYKIEIESLKEKIQEYKDNLNSLLEE